MNPDGIIHHPTIFHLFGPVEITGFGLAVLAAFVVAQIVCQHELTRRGHLKEADTMPDIVLAALLGTLIGGKSYYVILSGESFLSRGGFVFWGGFIGSVFLCWLMIRWRKLSFLRFADVAGIAIAAGYSVGRTGCWAVGDDYGHLWSGPFSAQFPEGAPPSTALVMQQQFHVQLPAGTPPDKVMSVHPTQLYETAMGFVMFLILWRFRGHQQREGWLFGMYCVLAGIERFIIEFFRAKDDRFFIGLTTAQIIAIAIFTIGVAIMAWRRAPSAGGPARSAALA